VAALRAIDAGFQRLGVFFFSFGQQAGAMVKTHVAHNLAVGADLGAFQKMFVMRIIGRVNR
jgi:hypothetical protein